jgi:hypothetical protein
MALLNVTNYEALLVAGLRAFKRPPSKHRQQWLQDSTSSGTTAGIRPGGSSISTVGSVVSSNTLYVPSDDERLPLGKKDWEDGLISTIREEGKDGGPSWEQVQELNGEVSDLRQRLVQEKEEANRLKLMVGCKTNCGMEETNESKTRGFHMVAVNEHDKVLTACRNTTGSEMY